MRTRVNWKAANALVDSYKDKLINSAMPSEFGSAWMRSEMARVGLIENREAVSFSEFWPLWFCCLIATGRVGEMSKIEKATVAKNGRTSGWSIRRMTRDSYKWSAQFRTESGRVLRELIHEQPWKD